ncbi:CaiB/BaiF CoA-transferase family protein [Actinomadura sp. 7K534]|uniref:CaiB/BaiF CoA transferase family protein n=1 Tax=Actinomadura sp. 7K534 TaxID=2530366 RepID=UPI001048A698|nr:CaiB/BaiF CoA-transferase family protein [Actinomadura sp. 7K534]TDB95187.1 CoA transferase [Actinomadura sp. 7K534]
MPGTGGPLTGITVVTLEQAVSAPLCTRTLGDLGARVIKVENPDGGDFTRYFDDVVHGLSAHFVWVNRGKESVALDVKSAAGSAVLHRLLDHADVLVSNLSPGATTRLGIGRADLARRHPRLIAVEIDGYGAGGPLSHKRAYDLLVQAESGACAITGHRGRPAKPGPPMADVCTGLYAALSIMAMLRDRDRDVRRGDGPATATVSLFDTMTELMGYALTHAQHTGTDQEPVGMGSPAVAPYGAYRTADDRTVVLGTTNDQEWQRLARDVLQRPDLAGDERFRTNPGRVAARVELDAEIAAWCLRHDIEHVQRAADAAGIGNSRYNLPTEVVAHHHLTARDRRRPVDTPGGPTTALLPPPVLSGYEPPMGAVPSLGEHTDSVLAGVGLSSAEIAELRAQGVIGPIRNESNGDGSNA